MRIGDGFYYHLNRTNKNNNNMSAMHSLHSTYTHIHKSTQHETTISYTATKLAAVPYIAIINKTG